MRATHVDQNRVFILHILKIILPNSLHFHTSLPLASHFHHLPYSFPSKTTFYFQPHPDLSSSQIIHLSIFLLWYIHFLSSLFFRNCIHLSLITSTIFFPQSHLPKRFTQNRSRQCLSPQPRLIDPFIGRKEKGCGSLTLDHLVIYYDPHESQWTYSSPRSPKHWERGKSDKYMTSIMFLIHISLFWNFKVFCPTSNLTQSYLLLDLPPYSAPSNFSLYILFVSLPFCVQNNI